MISPRLFITLLALLPALAQAVTCTDATIPPSNPDSIYIDHGDGTVTDIRTGLMWKKCPEGLSGADCATGRAATMTWAQALAHAEGHRFAGYSDWRLPNVRELLSLQEECRRAPSINNDVFPNVYLNFFWTSTPAILAPLPHHDSTTALAVNFFMILELKEYTATCFSKFVSCAADSLGILTRVAGQTWWSPVYPAPARRPQGPRSG